MLSHVPNSQRTLVLQEAAANRNLASYEAADAKEMWESEVKSRSHLGVKVSIKCLSKNAYELIKQNLLSYVPY